jgi:hypothetical protein
MKKLLLIIILFASCDTTEDTVCMYGTKEGDTKPTFIRCLPSSVDRAIVNSRSYEQYSDFYFVDCNCQ